MGGILTQFFPPSPTFTEKNLPSLAGKIFLVTGGNAGLGLELVKILYSKGGTVYIAGRNLAGITSEIKAIKDSQGSGPGRLEALHLDLANLKTVSACAAAFIAKEPRLDVLWNNAGISQAPAGTISAQGYEIHMATNCLGPFLLTKLLLPVLKSSASLHSESSVRVVFTSSGVIDMIGPAGGLSLEELTPEKQSDDKDRNYSASKAGNWFLASEFDKRVHDDGVLCLTQNPGTLKTKGWDRAPKLMTMFFKPFMYEAKFGAYTELWAGLSPEVKPEDGGRYAVPWGRWHPSPKKEILQSLKSVSEGGTGLAADFWDWCEEHTATFCAVESDGRKDVST